LKIIDGTKLYEVEDLVAMLKVSRITVQGYLRSGRIKGVKIGKRWHVTEKNLKDFLSGDTQGKATRKTGS
jgi:predicted site-specific integrase-resolvase